MTRLTIGSVVFSLGLSGSAIADQVFNDDVIVQGGLCVGTICSNGWGFGGTTAQIWDGNLFFGDSAGTTDRDWSIVANDDTFEFFLIWDDEASTYPFIIDGGAPSRSLQIRENGNIGLGTTGSSASIHIKRGDTPKIRFEQDGSNGNTPQSWSIMGNEVNFLLYDRTNDTDPFKIFPGSGNGDALTIASDGRIGMGTNSPDGPLHIVSGNDNTDLVFEQTNGATAAKWIIRNNAATGRITFRNDTTGNTPFKFGRTAVENLFRVGVAADDTVDINGKLTVDDNVTVNGTITTTGSCSVGCDAVFDPSYDLPSITDHQARMHALGYLPNVGPTTAGEPWDMADKLGRMLNELEHAHLFIGQQQEEIVHQRKVIQRHHDWLVQQEEVIAALTARLRALEDG